MAMAANAVDVDERVFNLLKRQGPLCASQIAVEVGLSLKRLEPTLDRLRSAGVIELRPDRDRSLSPDEAETPWGLARPALLRKTR